MTALFDGMAGVLNDTFGGPVTIYSGGLAKAIITAVIRDREIEVAGDDGQPVLATVTTLRALKPDVASLVVGDQVDGMGKSYQVLYRVPSASPEADRFETLVLESI